MRENDIFKKLYQLKLKLYQNAASCRFKTGNKEDEGAKDLFQVRRAQPCCGIRCGGSIVSVYADDGKTKLGSIRKSKQVGFWEKWCSSRFSRKAEPM